MTIDQIDSAYFSPAQRHLSPPDLEHDNCGVGFITRKDSAQDHHILKLTHEALCTIPHRGGMSSEGVGDGAGVNFDLSLHFFSQVTGRNDLQLGLFGVGNFFFARDPAQAAACREMIEAQLSKHNLSLLTWRDVPVNNNVLNEASIAAQQQIHQIVFVAEQPSDEEQFALAINDCLIDIEAIGFNEAELDGFYPLSMSARTQVLKGRLNSHEVVPYFSDLSNPDMRIHTIFFHTRFSTNTAPATMMAQPFRFMAHNGELNTDKKNRLSEDAIAKQKNKKVILPHGQSDSARLDQTMARRIIEDKLDIVTAVVAMMPPAWENDPHLDEDVVAMLEYFSLYEEKNDGPAALIFGNGRQVGARLDRLGLRPLRSVETNDYLAVMSEAGQIAFAPETVISRGRIEAGGMLYFDHDTGMSYRSNDVLKRLASEHDYISLLADSVTRLESLPEVAASELVDDVAFSIEQRHVAYSLNQETFKFLLDPMIQTGAEKISAMGYGRATNALTNEEGGMSKYFSQRFAQVTNPPLDSIREADGMTLRVALGPKPNFITQAAQQIVLETPFLSMMDLERIHRQSKVRVTTVDITFIPDLSDADSNEQAITTALEQVSKQVISAASDGYGIIVLSDAALEADRAALPLLLVIAKCNQDMIESGTRFNSSLVAASGQLASAHDMATALGFGASALAPISVHNRILSLHGVDEAAKHFATFRKAMHKSLLKTMGKFGLCTVESYIGGEIFESSYLDTEEPKLKAIFPNINSPVGGARYRDICNSAAEWHAKALQVGGDKQIPLLGLFKERNEGAGHTFGNLAVREFVNMTHEDLAYAGDKEEQNDLGIPPWVLNGESPVAPEDSHLDLGYRKRTPEEIDSFGITAAYRQFITSIYQERETRPSALRDILALAVDVTEAISKDDFDRILRRQNIAGNNTLRIKGLSVQQQGSGSFVFKLAGSQKRKRYQGLADHLSDRFPGAITSCEIDHLVASNNERLALYVSKIVTARESIDLSAVQPAHEITPTITSGAMSHGALVYSAHKEVAMGTNVTGALSNSGEGGEHYSRFDSIYASRIKQIASGRFGIWSGYLADPCLEELEIKIAQGAKPGEGGQLPAKKVTVEIASARGGTPGVELVSPPPHHDTYSIEDLAQLIHDCKAARVRVIVKLVSSEGIGTIAVGVAKAGADVINVAGNTGGTGAAAVTSLKNTGRSAEIGIAEVHQALAANGIREKVILRASAAHQTGLDVVKSCILGADSYEFGTTALMMIGCVMAKNCNIACPAGLTTNPEIFTGDGRKLAQFYLNLAHEVREILAWLGYSSLTEIRGKTGLLQLINHHSIVGCLDVRALLKEESVWMPDNPIYLEANFRADKLIWPQVKKEIFAEGHKQVVIDLPELRLDNNDKTVGGRTGIDIERWLNYQNDDDHPAVQVGDQGRRYLAADTVIIRSHGSAGQSFGAFSNDGMRMEHTGTANDGVGKSMSGGTTVIRHPGGGSEGPGNNVLVGNFTLFGATGGRLFVAGEAGDRCAVRNSGALCVVEGVGDFCCEYMTNGTVLNLGGAGKGFGNGMSGGIAYQYDPEGSLASCYNDTSVIVSLLNPTDPLMAPHVNIIRHLLREHVANCDSPKGKAILDNWKREIQHFRVVIPRALFNQHSAETLLKQSSRKALSDEIARAMAKMQVAQLKKCWDEGTDVEGGAIPSYGETDTALMFRLLNRFAVMNKALAVANKKLRRGSFELEQAHVDRYAKHLVRSLDHLLIEALSEEARQALGHFSDEELAILLSDKRIRDYKTTLAHRDIYAIQALGMTAWILYNDRYNHERMKDIPDFDQLLATYLMDALAEDPGMAKPHVGS